MECTYCNTELSHKDTYGFLASHQSGEVLGQIYRCPNHDGFDTKEEAGQYLIDSIDEIMNMDDVEEYFKKSDGETWEDVGCESSCHSVSGSFYTDKQDNLYGGYPC